MQMDFPSLEHKRGPFFSERAIQQALVLILEVADPGEPGRRLLGPSVVRRRGYAALWGLESSGSLPPALGRALSLPGCHPPQAEPHRLSAASSQQRARWGGLWREPLSPEALCSSDSLCALQGSC